MSKTLSDNGKAGRGWRLLVEIVQPPEWQDEHWVAIGLAAALNAIYMPAPDVERLENATVEAVARARRCQSNLDTVPPLVVVRVLISAPGKVGTAPNSWGFFIVERGAGETVNPNADVDWADGQPSAHIIDLCLYADAGLGSDKAPAPVDR